MKKPQTQPGERLKKIMRGQRVTGKKLAEYCGVSAAAASNWLATGVPYLRAKEVADYLGVTVEDIIAGSTAPPGAAPGYAELLIFDMTDKSMLPDLCVGDTLEIDTAHTDVEPGELVAANASGKVVIRRLDLGTGTPRLIAENSLYPPLVDFEIVGKVVSVTHRFD
tara:strand:+ start:251 stop:748 length:498 start_codon:yes stop_codon:yes gene_type:complete